MANDQDFTMEAASSASDFRSAARSAFESELELKKGEKVLLFGGYGTSNVGDDAILSGLLTALPEGVIPTVVSMNPSETERIHGVNSIPPIRVPYELLLTKAVVIGGGGMFSSHMGPMSKLLPLVSLFGWLMRKRVSYYGIGVYESTPTWVKKILGIALKRARLVTVRDAPSIATLRSMGIEAETVPDLASLLDETLVTELAEQERAEPGYKPTVALCLTRTNPDVGDRILEVMPEVIRQMQDVDFLFIPMSRHPVVQSHNDLLFARELQESAPSMQITTEYEHPANVLRSIRGANAAVCMRFHSMVFAERTGTPIVPVSYAPKTENWLDDRGLSSVEIQIETLKHAIRSAIGKPTLRQAS